VDRHNIPKGQRAL